MKKATILKLIEFIPKNIKKVGVFVNEKVEIVQNLSEKLNLDFIQLHGNENQNYINQINIPIIIPVSVSIIGVDL